MADKYWVGGGGNTNWGTVANWSLTSGGTGGAAIPVAGERVYFTGVGTNANGTSTIGSAITIGELIITGFTGTIAHNAVLTVNSTTLSTSYTITGTSGLIIGGNATLTSNGKTWPNSMTLATASATKTFADNWTIGGALISNATGLTINGSIISANGLTLTNPLSGTTQIILKGGTWSGANLLSNPIKLDGNITVSGTVAVGNGSLLEYISGTINVAGSQLNLSQTVYVDTDGMVWNNLVGGGNAIIELLSTLSASQLTISATTTNTIFTGVAAFEVGNLVLANTANAATVTLEEALEYKVNTGFNANTSRSALLPNFVSSSATVRSKLTLSHDAICNTNGNFTRIDASIGRSVNTWNGIVTDCLNVNSYTDYEPIGLTF